MGAIINEIDSREENVERTVSPELADELNYAPLANLKGHATDRRAEGLSRSVWVWKSWSGEGAVVSFPRHKIIIGDL